MGGRGDVPHVSRPEWFCDLDLCRSEVTVDFDPGQVDLSRGEHDAVLERTLENRFKVRIDVEKVPAAEKGDSWRVRIQFTG